MNIFPNRLSFFLTATGILLGIAGLLLPAAFGAAGAQTPAPPAQIMLPAAAPPSTTDQEAQNAPIPVVDQRDPFVPDAMSAPAAIQTNTVVAPQPQTENLPPEAQSSPVPATPASSPASEAQHDDLTGIVVGEHPYALVAAGGKTRLLSIGDAFQGRKIVTITMRGVALDNHTIAHIPLLDQ